MKNYFVCIALGFVFNIQARTRTISLQLAIDQRLIKAEAFSKGAYRGYCMNLKLHNLGPDSLNILIEAGYRLNSCEDKYQDILLVKEDRILLKKHETKIQAVKGYCCQRSNCAPAKNARYDFTIKADNNLVSLARFLSNHQLSEDNEQNAVWAISDKKPIAAIVLDGKEETLGLKQLLAQLRGEKLPWYSVNYLNSSSALGTISNSPTHLQGTMRYSLEKDTYITFCMLDEKGLAVCLIKCDWSKAGTNKSYVLNIPVNQLKSGKYKVLLKDMNTILASDEIEI